MTKDIDALLDEIISLNRDYKHYIKSYMNTDNEKYLDWSTDVLFELKKKQKERDKYFESIKSGTIKIPKDKPVTIISPVLPSFEHVPEPIFDDIEAIMEKLILKKGEWNESSEMGMQNPELYTGSYMSTDRKAMLTELKKIRKSPLYKSTLDCKEIDLYDALIYDYGFSSSGKYLYGFGLKHPPYDRNWVDSALAAIPNSKICYIEANPLSIKNDTYAFFLAPYMDIDVNDMPKPLSREKTCKVFKVSQLRKMCKKHDIGKHWQSGGFSRPAGTAAKIGSPSKLKKAALMERCCLN